MPRTRFWLLCLFSILLPLLAWAGQQAKAEPMADGDYSVYLPLLHRPDTPVAGCEIPQTDYTTAAINGQPSDRPAAEHGDLNLALRGYEPVSAKLALVDYDGTFEPYAPQLDGLFADQRLPTFVSAYQVYDWDWSCNCPGNLLSQWPVTLLGMQVKPGEAIHVPESGYNLGGYEAMVLYAAESRITLKYTREDNVVHGYTLHVENVCVEPRLLALYEQANAAGRYQLPALYSHQAFGRALNGEIRVAIRDTGSFMDPRTRKDWWQDH